jgi:formylglycine-generating enzyme
MNPGVGVITARLRHHALWRCTAIVVLLHFAPVHAAAPTTTFRDCRSCPELRVVPAGRFVMGSPANEEGRRLPSGADTSALAPEGRETQHAVEIRRPFAMGIYPVTRGQYAAFVRDTGYDPPNECFSSDRQGPGGHPSAAYTWDHPGFFAQTDDEPVVCVSANDALAYLDWLSRRTKQHYRLPGEAEWEYASRAGTASARYWGERAADGCTYANGIGDEAKAVFDGTPMGCDDRYLLTSPVGAYRPNAFGLYDMIGNVWQWVADCWHATYEGAPANEVPWGLEPNCKRSVMRGGSFVSNHTSMRAAARHEAWPSSRIFNYGFRVARDLKTKP